MMRNNYLQVNSEKAIFKNTKESDYIIHGLFVEDMIHISSCDESVKSLCRSTPKTLKSQEEA
jgi:hypothetical protein